MKKNAIIILFFIASVVCSCCSMSYVNLLAGNHGKYWKFSDSSLLSYFGYTDSNDKYWIKRLQSTDDKYICHYCIANYRLNRGAIQTHGIGGYDTLAIMDISRSKLRMLDDETHIPREFTSKFRFPLAEGDYISRKEIKEMYSTILDKIVKISGKADRDKIPQIYFDTNQIDSMDIKSFKQQISPYFVAYTWLFFVEYNKAFNDGNFYVLCQLMQEEECIYCWCGYGLLGIDKKYDIRAMYKMGYEFVFKRDKNGMWKYTKTKKYKFRDRQNVSFTGSKFDKDLKMSIKKDRL